MTVSIPEFGTARVLVAGDVMLDRYWFGQTERISPEAPVPVVHVARKDERPGGAANVAVNLARVGARAGIVGITGEDEAGGLLARRLRELGIHTELLSAPEASTVTKLRVVSRNQQLLRLDFEDAAGHAESEALAERVGRLLPDFDLIVLSDYAKGALRHVQRIIRTAREHGRPVLVDPKGRDFERYADATILTPNQAEFEHVVGHCRDDAELARRANVLRRELRLEAVVVTRGERGISVVEAGGRAHHLPAEVREVYDVTGAGDTVIALLGAGLAAGMTVEAAAELANLGAGLVVRRLGVAAVSRSELSLAMHRRGTGGQSIVDERLLEDYVAEAQARGERVVMTNGCFDIIHGGHIRYLQEAKSLGDRLVVAVNDDASVRRLKGAERPVLPLEERMEVLAGLAAVDWVIPFAEDTPERLICALAPDVLVKGGDYRPEEIAGADCVRAAGGEVRVLSFVAGRSTTGIIDAIRRR
jgi:D-beta-D-heptose 7-phosphate kinase/D-beta-D-heptose 1-phosphate adenosyltransferase